MRSTSPDGWKRAQSVGRNNESLYPFGNIRPTAEEVQYISSIVLVFNGDLWQLAAVYKVALGVTVAPGKQDDELDAYVAQVLIVDMFQFSDDKVLRVACAGLYSGYDPKADG